MILEEVGVAAAENYVFRSPRMESRQRSSKRFVERASEAFQTGRRLAGITRRISLHSTRHGFCTLLAERGKPLHVIKDAARHADVSTTLRYVHLANRHLKAELDDAFD